MKKYKNIDDLHAFLEREAKRTIKLYYTDWKNYDRPAIMRHTGEKTKEVYIIFRQYGSYLESKSDILNYDFSATVMDYYKDDKSAKYYKVDFSALTIEKIQAGLPSELKREREERERIKHIDKLYYNA